MSGNEMTDEQRERLRAAYVVHGYSAPRAAVACGYSYHAGVYFLKRGVFDGVSVKCVKCGNEFPKTRNVKYCSDECRARENRDHCKRYHYTMRRIAKMRRLRHAMESP